MAKKRVARMDYMGFCPLVAQPVANEKYRTSEQVRNIVNLWVENHELFKQAVLKPGPSLQLFQMILHLSGMRWQISEQGTYLFYCERDLYLPETLDRYVKNHPSL